MNIRKTAVAIFIVSMFLTSSTLVVNAGTEDIKKISMYTAYVDELDDVKTDIDMNYDSSPDLEISVQNPIKLQPNVKISPKKYAVIMVGRYFGLLSHLNLKTIQQFYTWYLRDAGRLYTTLRDTYGYDEDNIFLLVRLLPDCFDIPESFNPDWIDYTSSKENLETVLGTFKPEGENELTENDQLFICIIDHGGNKDVNYYGNDQYTNEFISPDNHISTGWVDEYKAYDTYEVDVHDYYHDTGTGAVFRKPKTIGVRVLF